MRLNTVSHLLNHTHYDAIPAEKVMLPRRKIGRYKTGDDTFRYIPQRH